MNILKKVQDLPEFQRKIILWATVIIIASGLLIWWWGYTKARLRAFQEEGFLKNLPSLENGMKELPKIETPEIKVPEVSEEELKKLEEMMKESEQ